MPISITAGNSYKNVSTTGRIYDSGDGAAIYPGQSFVASESARGNELLSMGFGYGDIVEVPFGTAAARALRFAALQAEVRDFVLAHFGNGYEQNLKVQTVLKTEYLAGGDSLFEIVITQPVEGDTSLAGTLGATTKLQTTLNGVNLGASWSGVAGAITHVLGATLVAGDVVGLYAVDASDNQISNPVTITSKFEAPVITTSPIDENDTSFSGTSASPDDTVITVYAGSTALGLATVTSNAWTITSIVIAIDQVLTAYAGSGNSRSAVSNSVTVGDDAPVITDTTYTSASTSVSGTAASPDGTIVTLYKAGSVSLGTTTVTSGAWTKGSLTLAGADSLTAKARVGTPEVSRASAPVVVHYIAPVITGSYADADTTVNGTMTAPDTTLITVYRNGVSAGTTTVTGNAWSLAGLTALVGTDSVTATAGTGANVSAASTAVVVHYDAPVITSENTEASNQCNGTSTAADGAVVNAYINDVWKAASTVSGGAFVIDGVVPQVGGDSLTAKVGVLASASLSAASTPKIVRFNAPTIEAAVIEGATTVNGTTSPAAADGVAVEIFDTGVSIGTGVVAGGAGAFAVTTSATVATSPLTAKVGTGANLSNASSTRTVKYAAPVITTPVVDAATTVSGTCSTGAVVNLYYLSAPTVQIGDSPQTAVGTAWTVSTLTLVPGEEIIAKTGTHGAASQSAASATVTVQWNAATVAAVAAGAHVTGTTVTVTDGTAVTLYKSTDGGGTYAVAAVTAGGTVTTNAFDLTPTVALNLNDKVKVLIGTGASTSEFSNIITVTA